MGQNALASRSPEGAIHQSNRAVTGLLDEHFDALVAVHADKLTVGNQQTHRLDFINLHAYLRFIGADARELAVGRARFGGDEFVLVFPGQEDAKAALQVAGKIIDAFQEAITLDGHSLTITTSIGISLYPDHGADIDTILQNADNVMYQAKQSGRNRYQLYNEA